MGKERFSVFGAGKLGTHLAYALEKRGYHFKYIYPSSKYPLYADRVNQDIQQIVYESDFLVIAVRESGIGEIASLVARHADPGGKIFFHTSNSLTSLELESLRKRGGIIASFSPLQTFVDFNPGEELFPGIYFLAEGDSPALTLTGRIARDLGAKMIPVEKEEKVYLHMAAVSACNFLVALLKFSQKQLQRGNGGDDLEVLMPLIKQTLKNIESRGLPGSLSGPVERGETGIVSRHLEHLEGLDAQLYRILSDYLQV